MCIFCAAIPMSAAIGAAVSGKRHHVSTSATSSESAVIEQPVPVGKITLAVTGSLITCSAVYHLVIAPHTGIPR